jgi:hypothetical protein
MQLETLLQTLKPEELQFIAERDYSQGADEQLEALRRVVERGGRFEPNEQWHPYEVVELGAHALVPGHEREFAACTLLVISAVVAGFDLSTDLTEKFADRAEDYGKLPLELQEPVLAAYSAAGL